jgi:hypothetical protein
MTSKALSFPRRLSHGLFSSSPTYLGTLAPLNLLPLLVPLEFLSRDLVLRLHFPTLLSTLLNQTRPSFPLRSRSTKALVAMLFWKTRFAAISWHTRTTITAFMALVERLFHCKVGILHNDKGGEYINQALQPKKVAEGWYTKQSRPTILSKTALLGKPTTSTGIYTVPSLLTAGLPTASGLSSCTLGYTLGIARHMAHCI